MRILIDQNIDRMDLAAALAEVSEQRRKQVLALRSEQQQRQSVAVYRLLQTALEQDFGIAEPPLLAYEPGGKPFLADYPHIFFNWSHTRGVVVCAVDTRPVGVDVEHFRPYRDPVARRVLSPEEYRHVAESARPDIAFLRLWTRKEALLKLTGEGIRRRLDGVDAQAEPYLFRTEVCMQQQVVWSVCQEKSDKISEFLIS